MPLIFACSCKCHTRYVFRNEINFQNNFFGFEVSTFQDVSFEFHFGGMCSYKAKPEFVPFYHLISIALINPCSCQRLYLFISFFLYLSFPILKVLCLYVTFCPSMVLSFSILSLFSNAIVISLYVCVFFFSFYLFLFVRLTVLIYYI